MSAPNSAEKSPEKLDADIQTLLPWMVENSPGETARLLREYPDDFAVSVLELLNPAMAQDVLDCIPSDRRQAIFAAASPETRHHGCTMSATTNRPLSLMEAPPRVMAGDHDRSGRSNPTPVARHHWHFRHRQE
jgi:hypothetical protein